MWVYTLHGTRASKSEQSLKMIVVVAVVVVGAAAGAVVVVVVGGGVGGAAGGSTLVCKNERLADTEVGWEGSGSGLTGTVFLLTVQ